MRASKVVSPCIPRSLPVSTLHHRLGLHLRHYLGDAWVLDHSRMRDWASATFVGARHHFTFCLQSHDQDLPTIYSEKLVKLVDQDFDMPGHLVADIGTADHDRVTVDAIFAHRITLYVLSVEMD